MIGVNASNLNAVVVFPRKKLHIGKINLGCFQEISLIATWGDAA